MTSRVITVTVTSFLSSQLGCSWSVFRRVLMIVSSGRWTTEEVSSSGPDSVMRCLWGRSGSLYQVHTCLVCRHVSLIYTPVSSTHLSHLYTSLTYTPVCVIHTPVFVLNCVLCTAGLSVSQLVLSSRTVWVRCVNGDLARRYGVSDRNPAGDYWKKIPGHANWLTGETGLCVLCVS